MQVTLPIRTAIVIVFAVVGFFVIDFTHMSASMAFVAGALLTGVVLLLLHVATSDSHAVTQSTSSTRPTASQKRKSPKKAPADTDLSIIDNDAELTTLYIGNLAYRVQEKAIKAHFAQYGYVDSVRLMKDRKTGKRKGFGFVEVSSDDAQAMIDNLNDTQFSERTLKVRLAKEKGND